MAVQACNATCECRLGEFAPICGSDGKTYLSPCVAGCTKVLEEGDDVRDDYFFYFGEWRRMEEREREREREREWGGTTTYSQLCWGRACVMLESTSKNDINGRKHFSPWKHLISSCLFLLNNKTMIMIKNEIMLHAILNAMFFIMIMHAF